MPVGTFISLGFARTVMFHSAMELCVTQRLLCACVATVVCCTLTSQFLQEMPSLFCYTFFFYSKIRATDAVFLKV